MKESERYIIPIGVVFISFIVYMLINHIREDQYLNNNAKNGSAIIERFFNTRNAYYFSYQFKIDGKEYKGSGTYFPNSDMLSIGDTISIMFDEKIQKTINQLEIFMIKN